MNIEGLSTKQVASKAIEEYDKDPFYFDHQDLFTLLDLESTLKFVADYEENG